jgi:cytochrome P450
MRGRTLARWGAGQSRAFYADLRQLTLEIAAKALFSVGIGDWVRQVARGAEPIMEFNARRRILVPLVRYLATPMSLRYRLAVRRLERVVRAIIGTRATEALERENLLSILLAARDERGYTLTRRQLRDEVMTLLLAGHETTSLALCWTFYLLSRHNAVDQRLSEEVAGVAGERPIDILDLPRLQYAQNVIRESMRLYPPAFAMARGSTGL